MKIDHNQLPVVIIKPKINNCDRGKNVLILLIGKTNSKYSGIFCCGPIFSWVAFAEMHTFPLTTFYSKKTRRKKSQWAGRQLPPQTLSTTQNIFNSFFTSTVIKLKNVKT